MVKIGTSLFVDLHMTLKKNKIDEAALKIAKDFGVYPTATEVMDRIKENIRPLVTEMFRESEYRQSQIDSLMLEFCPQDMTPEQLINWAEHQQARTETEEETKAIRQALSTLN